MNSFCSHLQQSLSNKFKIEVDFFVSKKKNSSICPFSNIYYPMNFLRKSLNILDFTGIIGKKILPRYFFVYPKLNQSLKWHFDYIIIVNNKTRSKKDGRAIR